MIEKDVLDIVCCPNCQSNLIMGDELFVCDNCNSDYRQKNEILVLISKELEEELRN